MKALKGWRSMIRMCVCMSRILDGNTQCVYEGYELASSLDVVVFAVPHCSLDL